MSDQVRKRAGPLAAGGKPEPRGNGRGGQGPPKRGHKCLSCARRAGALALLATAVIILLPQHIDPVCFRFSNDSMRPFEGALEVNSELKRAQLLFPGNLVGPEAFTMDEEGFIYTGLADGRVVRLTFDLQSYVTVMRVGKPPYDKCGSTHNEDHCGRVLGLHHHHSNHDIIYAADTTFGLLQLNIQSKEVEILVPQIQGVNPAINFGNDLLVLPNGSVFFTDSTTKFSRHDSIFDIFEGRPNGQLLHYNPVEGVCHLVVAEMYFPNGICLSSDGQALLIAETSRARIRRYHLSGPLAGTLDTFIDNLPGLPDNITPSRRGNYWVAFAVTRKLPLTDKLTELPWLRALIVKLGLTRLVAHMVPKHALIIEVDHSGRILRSLHDNGGEVLQSISHVLDLGDRLLLGSYEAPHAAVLHL